MDRARRDLTSNPAAYDLYLRGLASWNRWSRDDNAKALTFFYAAIEKDPEFATPYGLAASCYQFDKANGWQSNFDEQEISRLTERAVDLGSDDAVALCWAGHVRAFFFKEVERALVLINRALELDVNLAAAWQRSGWVRGYAGDPDGAIRKPGKSHAAQSPRPARIPYPKRDGFCAFHRRARPGGIRLGRPGGKDEAELDARSSRVDRRQRDARTCWPKQGTAYRRIGGSIQT